jgi:hypothetical protein
MRGHNTGRYSREAFVSVHKLAVGIGPVPCKILHPNFRE